MSPSATAPSFILSFRYFFIALYSYFVSALLSSLALPRLHGLFPKLLTVVPAARVFIFGFRAFGQAALSPEPELVKAATSLWEVIRTKKRHTVTPLTVVRGLTTLYKILDARNGEGARPQNSNAATGERGH